jgi:hypothetical protein
MTEQANTAAKRENKKFWRKCPICVQNKVTSPEFQEFLRFIEHMEEHLQPEARPKKKSSSRYVTEEELLAFSLGVELLEVPKGKIADKAGLLVLVSLWLQEALAACSELNNIRTSDLKVADQLVDLVRTLPDDFAEQRTYLMQHQDRLREAGMDPKWPRRPGSQVGFVADSMAGARWSVPPSSSREYIRRINPKRKSLNRGVAARAGLLDDLVKEAVWWNPETLDKS